MDRELQLAACAACAVLTCDSTHEHTVVDCDRRRVSRIANGFHFHRVEREEKAPNPPRHTCWLKVDPELETAHCWPNADSNP